MAARRDHLWSGSRSCDLSVVIIIDCAMRLLLYRCLCFRLWTTSSSLRSHRRCTSRPFRLARISYSRFDDNQNSFAVCLYSRPRLLRSTAAVRCRATTATSSMSFSRGSWSSSTRRGPSCRGKDRRTTSGSCLCSRTSLAPRLCEQSPRPRSFLSKGTNNERQHRRSLDRRSLLVAAPLARFSPFNFSAVLENSPTKKEAIRRPNGPPQGHAHKVCRQLPEEPELHRKAERATVNIGEELLRRSLRILSS